MGRCEVCGSSYKADVMICPRCNVAVSPDTPAGPAAAPSDLRTAYLGRFDPYEADLIVEILTGEDIIAFTKIPRTDPNFTEYGPLVTDQGVVIVDAARLDDARRIVAEELPKQLHAIAFEMDALTVGDEDPSEDGEDGEAGGGT